jgi:hypothetical protein
MKICKPHTDWLARFLLYVILMNTLTNMFARVVCFVCATICFFMWATDGKEAKQ